MDVCVKSELSICSRGEHQSAQNAGSISELCRNHVAIDFVSEFRSADVAVQHASELFPDEREQVLLFHHAPAEYDSLW